jgi:methionyl-tRNA formyltransferase
MARHVCSFLLVPPRFYHRQTQSSFATLRQQFRLYSTQKKRVVFLGTPEVAADSLLQIHQASLAPDSVFELSAVVTQPAKRRKRKGKVEASPVGRVAEDIGIQVLTPESAKDDDFLTLLEQQAPDLFITAAYGQYLPKRFLAMAPTVNIHPSLLPRWRGASPVQRSLEAGDNPVGVTVLFTVSKMDAGPIVARVEQTIDENDTATTVLPLLFQLGTNLLLEKLPDVLQGKITMETATPQDEEQVTLAKMIDSAEAELRVWEESALACHNRLRGFSMWPQTFMYVQVEDVEEPIKLKVLETRVVDDQQQPTDVISLGPTKQSGLYVVCGDGSVLELVTVQPATRKAFPARDFQNGYPGKTIRWVQPPALEKE